ncbi:Eukaryotic translation initiation factor 2-alpha kinase [Folsomia candida]|uniref:non-specific serine/threonine protein kinase n=2 Tax=Folsomia candida TaxID=158441 RepID=A0A226D6W4_FOLCA|nr:Eukaryotic translation initiation factor 2-alpha kinase [Folsomia candida]
MRQQEEWDEVDPLWEIWKQQLPLPNSCSNVESNPLNFPIIACISLQTELCNLGTLRDWMQRNRTRTLINSINFVSQVASGLHFVHSRKIVHRDLKPDNIYLNQDSVSSGIIVKIGDFGLAKVGKESQSINQAVDGNTHAFLSGKFSASQSGLGTEIYMSPEQHSGLQFDAKTDIYALGIIFLELSINFENISTRLQIITNMRNKDPKLPKDFEESMPFQSKIIFDMLSDNQILRPTAEQLVQRFDNHVRSVPLEKLLLPMGNLNLPASSFSIGKYITELETATAGDVDVPVIFLSGGAGVGKRVVLYELANSLVKHQGFTNAPMITLDLGSGNNAEIDSATYFANTKLKILPYLQELRKILPFSFLTKLRHKMETTVPKDLNGDQLNEKIDEFIQECQTLKKPWLMVIKVLNYSDEQVKGFQEFINILRKYGRRRPLIVLIGCNLPHFEHFSDDGLVDVVYTEVHPFAKEVGVAFIKKYWEDSRSARDNRCSFGAAKYLAGVSNQSDEGRELLSGKEESVYGRLVDFL